VYSCGFGGSFFNGAGGLGQGDRQQRETPTILDAFGEEAEVLASTASAGGYHSLALDTERGMWSWGRGEWGRLGFGDSSDQLEPQQLDEQGEGGGPPIEARALVAGEAHSACLAADGRVFTWGRNEHWQLGYEVAGLLNSGQSFDAQAEPAEVPWAEAAGEGARARMLAVGEKGTAVLLEDERVLLWGMARHFHPTLVPGIDAVAGRVVDMQVGADHLALLTDEGRVWSYGKGTALAMPKAERKSWELLEVTAHSLIGRRVLQIACGSNTTAFIVEP
jgi:E3 ubiquitin-protein ligase HERC2